MYIIRQCGTELYYQGMSAKERWGSCYTAQRGDEDNKRWLRWVRKDNPGIKMEAVPV